MNEDMPAGGGELILSAEVWPTHVGFTTIPPGPGPQPQGEPVDSPEYTRGQIAWTVMPNDEIVGRTRVFVPAGTYTHMVYLHGPGSLPMMCGARVLPHPVSFAESGFIDIDPINCGDWKPVYA
jgi:hypothetical protein